MTVGSKLSAQYSIAGNPAGRLWFRGVTSNYVQMAAGFGSMVFMTPLILGHVGAAGYGLWAIIGSLQNYCLLLDFGMNTATAKYTAEYRALQRTDELNTLASTIVCLVLCVGVVIIGAAAMAAPWVSTWLRVPEPPRKSVALAVVVMGVNAAAMLVAGVFGNIIYGHHRTDVWKLFGTVQTVLNSAAGIGFLHLGFGILGLAWAGVIANVTLIALSVWFISTYLTHVRIDFRLSSLRALRDVFPYSARALGLSVTSRLLYYTDYIVIGVFLGAAAVAPYEIGYKVCFLATYSFSVLSFAVFPRFSELTARGQTNELRAAYLRLVKLTMLVLVPVDLCLLVWGRSLIQFWLGPDNTPPQRLIVVLVVMNIFHAIGTPASTFLQSAGRNRELAWSETINAALNVALSILLVRRLGPVGVAIGTLVAHLATSFWVVVLLPCRTLELSWRRYARSAILPPLLLGCPFLLALLLPIRPPSSLFAFGFSAVTLSTLYLAAYATLGATKVERRELKRFLLIAWKPSLG